MRLFKEYIPRGSRPELLYKNDVYKNFAEFTDNLFRSLLFNYKVAGWRPATLSKKGLWHRCCHVNSTKFPILFLWNTCKGLLLYITWLISTRWSLFVSKNLYGNIYKGYLKVRLQKDRIEKDIYNISCMYVLVFQRTSCLRLVNRFSSLKRGKKFDALNSNQKKEKEKKKEKNTQFTTF